MNVVRCFALRSRFGVWAAFIVLTLLLPFLASAQEVPQGASGSTTSVDAPLGTGSTLTQAPSEQQVIETHDSSDIVVPSEEGMLRSALPGGIGIAVWNADRHAEGILLEQSPLSIGGGPGERPGSQSVTIAFAGGRKSVANVALSLSSDFEGALVLTDRAGGLKAFSLHGSQTGALFLHDSFGSMTLVVKRGTGLVSGIEFDAETHSDGELALTPDAATAARYIEQVSALVLLRTDMESELSRERELLRSSIEQKDAAISDTQESITLSSTALGTLRATLTEKESSVAAGESRMTTLATQIEEHTRKKASLISDRDLRLIGMQSELSRAQALAVSTQSGFLAAGAKAATAQATFDAAKTDLAAAQQSLTEMLIAASGSKLTIGAAQKDLDAAKKSLQIANAALKIAQQARKKDLTAEKLAVSLAEKWVKDATTALNAAKLAVPTATALQRAKTLAVTKQKAVDAALAALTIAQTDLAKATAARDAAASTVADKQKAIDDMNAAIATEDDLITRLQTELDGLTASLPSLRSSVEGLRENVDSQQSTIDALKQVLQDLTLERAELADFPVIFTELLVRTREQVEIAKALQQVADIIMQTRKAELPPILVAADREVQSIADLKNELLASTQTGSLSERLAGFSEQGNLIQSHDATLDSLAAQSANGDWLAPARTRIDEAKRSLASAADVLRAAYLSWTDDVKNDARKAAGKYADIVPAAQSGSHPTTLLADAIRTIDALQTQLKNADAVSIVHDDTFIADLSSALASIDAIERARLEAEKDEPWVAPIDAETWSPLPDLPVGARAMFVHPGEGNAYTAILDPQGERMLVTSQGPRNVMVIDAKTADPSTAVHMVGHTAIVTGSAWSPDSLTVATASHDHTVKLWDSRTGELILSIPLNGPSSGVAFTPDGKRLVIAVDEGSSLLYDIDAKTVIKELPSGVLPVVTRDGVHALFVDAHDVIIRNIVTDETHRVALPLGSPSSLAVSADGVEAYAGNTFGTIYVIDLHSFSIRKEIKNGDYRISSIAPEPTGRLLVADEENVILVYENIANELTKTSTAFRVNAPPTSLSASPTGSGFTVLQARTRTGKSQVVHFNLPVWSGTKLIAKKSSAVLSAADIKNELQAFGEVVSQVKAATTDVSVTEWKTVRADMDNLLSLYGLDERQSSVAAGESAIDTAAWPGIAGVYAGEAGSFIPGGTGVARFAALSPDGSKIALGYESNQVQLVDAATGQKLSTVLKGNGGAVNYVSWSPDSTKLATAGADATIRAFDVRTGAELLKISLTHSADSVVWGIDDVITYAVAGSPVQRYSMSDKSTASVPCQACSALNESPDGQYIIFSDDRVLSIFNRFTKSVKKTAQQPSYVYASTWSTDGNRAYFGFSDGGTVTVDRALWKDIHFDRMNRTAVRSLAADGYHRILQGHDDGSVYLLQANAENVLVPIQEWHIGMPAASLSVSPSGKSFIVTSDRVGAPVLHFALPIPESAQVQAATSLRAQSSTTAARQAIVALGEKYESDNFRQFAREMAEGPTEREEFVMDEQAMDLLAKSAAVEINAKKSSEKFEELKDAYVDTAALKDEALLPSVIASMDTMFDTLDAGRERTAALSNGILRDAIRIGADIQRSQALSSDGIVPVVSADDSIDIASAPQTSGDERVKRASYELVNLGGTVTVQSLRGNTDGLSLQSSTSGIKSVAKGTMLDFGTAGSLVTGVTLSIDIQTGSTVYVHVLRGSQDVAIMETGTGHTITVDDPEGISAILLEHPMFGMSQEAQDWAAYLNSYQSDYLYSWQDPGPAYHYFDILHPALNKGAVMAEAARGVSGIPVTIRSLVVRGNIASPITDGGLLTPMKNGAFARFWTPKINSAFIPNDSFYEQIPQAPGKYTGVTTTAYRGSPVIEAVGTVMNGNFTPLPQELTQTINNTLVIAPLPSGTYLAARTSGGVSSRQTANMPVGSWYDFDLNTIVGNSPEEVQRSAGQSIDIRSDLCAPNTGGDGWFEGAPYSFSCDKPVALGTIKTRTYFVNNSRESGTFTVTYYSGSPTTEDSESPVYSGTVSLASGQAKGLWKAVPIRADSEGRGLVRIVVKDALGTVVGDSSQLVGPPGIITAEQMALNVQAAFHNQAIAMQEAAEDTKTYYASIGVTNPPSSYDWQAVIAQIPEAVPEAPLPADLAERLMRNAVNAKAYALVSGDPVRIAAAESQLAGALVAYGGALSYAGSPDADRTPAALVAFIEDKVRRDDTKQKIAQAQTSAKAFMTADTLNLARMSELVTSVAVVAKSGAVWDTPVNGVTIQSPKTQEYQFGILAERSAAQPEQGIEILGKKSDANVYFTIKDAKKMVNLWVDSISMPTPDAESVKSLRNISLTLRKTDGIMQPVISNKADPDAAESISAVLEPGSYKLQVQDQTTYAFSSSSDIAKEAAARIPVPLFIQVTPYTSQHIVGRISIEGREVTMPVSMSVAEFRDNKRIDNYSLVSELKKDMPVWVVVHGRTSSEKGDNINDLAKALYEFDQVHRDAYQVATVDWEMAAKDNSLLPLEPLRDAMWTPAVGAWTAQSLLSAGLVASQINLIGHSHGTYAGYFAAKEINAHSKGITHSIVALDPAVNVRIFNGSHPIDESIIRFSEVADSTLAIKSSVDRALIQQQVADSQDAGSFLYQMSKHIEYGSDARTKTAHIALELKVPGEIDKDHAHGYPVTAFADMIRRSLIDGSLTESKIGLLRLLNSSMGLMTMNPQREYDGTIAAFSYRDTEKADWWKAEPVSVEFQNGDHISFPG